MHEILQLLRFLCPTIDQIGRLTLNLSRMIRGLFVYIHIFFLYLFLFVFRNNCDSIETLRFFVNGCAALVTEFRP